MTTSEGNTKHRVPHLQLRIHILQSKVNLWGYSYNQTEKKFKAIRRKVRYMESGIAA